MSTSGRSQQKNTANAAQGNIGAGQGVLGTAQNVENASVNTNGGLSPLVSRQLAGNEADIGKSYASAAQGAQRGLAQRGMSAAPSGLQASLLNSQINNAGQAKSNAINQAFGAQQNLNLAAQQPAISALGAQSGAINSATGTNQALSNMPTLGGQIFSGLQGLGGMANNASQAYKNTE